VCTFITQGALLGTSDNYPGGGALYNHRAGRGDHAFDEVPGEENGTCQVPVLNFVECVAEMWI
jgi:hypothetical protein